MLELKLFDNLTAIEAAAWNACFADELEGYAYLIAVENSGITGFNWRYLTAWQNGELVAAVPAFLTDYPLDTTAQGATRSTLNIIKRLAPNALTLKLACLGSPVIGETKIGFQPIIAPAERVNLLQQMLRFFAEQIGKQGYHFLGIKDISEHDNGLCNEAAAILGYRGIAGMPTAYLDINFTSIDDYFTRLSYGTRKDMRRKLRVLDQIRVEHRRNIDDVLPQIMQMYQETRSRSDWQFEELTAEYFTGVLQQMGERALCTLYYAGEQLLAANFLLCDQHLLLDKFFCMGAAGRDYHLYFLSWFVNIQYCLDHGLTRYQSGQAAYQNKLRLGSNLIRTTMYFRHRNPIFHTILNVAAPFLAADETLKTNFKQAA